MWAGRFEACGQAAAEDDRQTLAARARGRRAGLIFRFNLVRGHLPILVRGDFGGWSVGSSIAWAATGSVGYRWILPRLDIGIDLAYRALRPNYEKDGFGWNVVMHGPQLALAFEF